MDRGKAVTRVFLFAVAAVPLVYSPFTLDLTLTARFIFLACAMLAAAVLLYRSQNSPAFKIDLVILSYLAYVLCCVLSLLWAKNKSEALFEASKVVLFFFAFYFTVFCLERYPGFFKAQLQKISVVLSFIALLAGFWQYLQVADNSIVDLYTITGLNSHKNLYASFTFLNLYFLILAATQQKNQWRLFARLALGLSFILLIALQTKAVWAGLAVAACTAGLIYGCSRVKTRLKYGLLAGIVASLLCVNVFFFFALQPAIAKGLAYNAAEEQLSGGKPVFDQERLQIWEKTYHMVGQYRLLGVGMGNWQVFFPDATLSGLWRVEDLNYTFQRPHNDFLWILAETGVIGFNLYLFFLLALLWMALRAIRKSEKGTSAAAALAMAIISGYCAVSFFDFPRERIEHGLWLSLICGSLYYYIRETNRPSAIMVVPNNTLLRTVTIGLLGFILLTGGLRHQGEFHTHKMLERRSSAEVISEGLAAKSFAYSLDPTSVPLSWYVGNAYVSAGESWKAHASFQEAYRQNPYNRNVLNDLASSYAMLHDMEAAKKFYMEAARISPRFDDPKLNLIAIYINEQNYQLASDWIKTLFHNSERRSDYQRIIDVFLPK